MTTALRLDVGDFREVRRTPTGGLAIDGTIARTGVLRYRDGTGREWGELVTPEVLFAADSMASLRNAAVTMLHPDAGRVTPETYQQLTVGTISADSVHAAGPHLDADVLVQAAPALRKVDAKELRELSAGYEVKLEERHGVLDGQAYDYVQTERAYNHVALLPPGGARAGSVASLHLDGAAVQVREPMAAQVRTDAGTPARTEAGMRTIKVKGKSFKLDADADVIALEEAITALEQQIVALGPQNEAVQKQLDELKDALKTKSAQLEALQAQFTARAGAPDAAAAPAQAAPVAITEDMVPPAVADSIAVKRLALVDRAASLGVKREDCAGKGARQIRELAVAKCAPDFRVDSKRSDAEITAAFDVLQAPRNDALARTAAAVEGIDPRTGQRTQHADDADLGPAEKARRDMANETANRWKTSASKGN